MAKESIEIGTHEISSLATASRTVRTKDGNRFKIDTAFVYEAEDAYRRIGNMHFRVSYSFERSKRSYVFADGHKYGADGMYFDRLYVILCEAFNGGEKFIDTYLTRIFPDKFGKELAKMTNKIKQSMLDEVLEAASKIPMNKDGGPSKRSPEFKALSKLLEKHSKNEKDSFDEFSKRVRQHIIQCLSSGRIPLQIALSDATLDKRELAGIESNKAFFASGQLIHHLSLQLEARIGA